MKIMFQKRALPLFLAVILILSIVLPQIISFANTTPADVIIIDDENAVAGTANIANWAGTVETNIVKVGNKSLKSVSGSDRIVASQYVWRTTEFNAPKDITAVTKNGTDGALRFWFYIDNIETFDAKNRDESKGFVKIGTTTWKNETTPNSNPDAGSFYRWKGWTTQVTQSGWNEIVLKFQDASTQNGKPDLTCIDKFMISYPDGTAATTAYIDNFHVSANTNYTSESGNEPDPKPEPDPNPAPSDIVNLPIEGSKSGTGLFNLVFEDFVVDASNIINPHLQISIYIAKDNDQSASVNDLLGKRQIELTSSGIYDKAEIHWDMSQFTLETGWNNLLLPLSEAIAHDGGEKFDISAINYFRLYNQHLAGGIPYTLKVKDVAIISVKDADTTPKTQVIAKLDGTEWPIVHPGLSGQFNSGDYEAMNFDRRFSGIPSGDIKTYAYVTREAKSWQPIDATKHNLLTFDIVVEDNGAWNTYKDGLIIKLMTIDKGNIDFATSALKNALESVIPGEKCRVAISLASIGKKNLSKVDGFRVEIGDTISDKVLHLTITNACVEFNDEYPIVNDEPVLDNVEPKTEIVFAKLDGTEWPIVHPGLSGQFHKPDFDAMNFDRYLNFNATGDIKNKVDIIRTDVYKDKPADFTDCNVITFNVFIEDNGAWEDYKGKIKMSVISNDNVSHPISTGDVTKAFANVTVGEWCKISVSLASLHKGEINSIKTISFSLANGSSKKNLHLRVLRVMGEYNKAFKAVPEIPQNDDNTLILNDEFGEKAWPSSLTSDISKFGNKSYCANTFVTEKGYNEGWLIRMGFWGNPINRVLDIKEFTSNGTEAAIRFWIYAENAEEVRTKARLGAGSYCRYGSTNNWDGDAFEWRGWDSQIVNDGWNEIVLPFEYASKRGNPDLTKMSAFALKFGEGDVSKVPKTQVYIDDIRLSKNTKTALPVSYETTINSAKMFQPFEEMKGFGKEPNISEFEIDIKEKTQGMASLKFTTVKGEFLWVYRAGKNTADATGYNALEFDLYVSNPEFFEYSGGHIELTSSGTWDQNEMAFSLKDLKLNKGWNHIILSFDFASYSKDFRGQPDIDLTAINFIRMYTGKSQGHIGQEIVFRIDNMCFTKNGEARVEKTVITTNNTSYKLYLTAKPEVIPSYGEIVVNKKSLSELPKEIRALFTNKKNTVILTPTYYKDGIEYLFKDSVTVHLSKENLAGLKNKYLYRLDVNGSIRKISRIDNKSKNELVWDEPSRLVTYIISDIELSDKEILDIDNNVNDLDKANSKITVVIYVIIAALVLLAGVVTVIIVIKKRKNK